MIEFFYWCKQNCFYSSSVVKHHLADDGLNPIVRDFKRN